MSFQRNLLEIQPEADPPSAAEPQIPLAFEENLFPLGWVFPHRARAAAVAATFIDLSSVRSTFRRWREPDSFRQSAERTRGSRSERRRHNALRPEGAHVCVCVRVCLNVCVTWWQPIERRLRQPIRAQAVTSGHRSLKTEGEKKNDESKGCGFILNNK